VFLGQTDPCEVDRLAAAMAMASVGHAPFQVTMSEAGGRIDDRRGGVAWMRIAEGTRELAGLSVELDRLVGSNTYARGAPRPHITVARRVDAALLDDLRQYAEAIRLGWVIERIVLYRSHGDPGGSRYEELAVGLLTGRVTTS
jgi:2'-5' RNA ligase